MIRLLIVDDEPYTVDGLYEMLSEIPDLELDLYRAYSAEEAMERLTRNMMDIVLSDIRMPGMNGLELQHWIHIRWPRCKVLFLTGMSNIQYAQQAIRGGGADYILKTEGDEKIVLGIRKAICALNEETLNEQFIIRAKGQFSQALPILQKEWFIGLTNPRNGVSNWQPSRFQELEIPLSPQGRILLVGGKVDRWKAHYTSSDQMLLSYAIQNIAAELLAQVNLLPILLDGSQFVWLMQPANKANGDGQSGGEETWSSTASFVKGTLESIQLTCKNLLKLPVSLVCTDTPILWEDLPQTYAQLKQTLVLGLGDGEEMLVTFSKEVDLQGGFYENPDTFFLEDLRQALESGQEAAFEKVLDELFVRIPNRFGIYAQTYYAIAVLLLAHINKLEQTDPSLSDQVVERLLNLSAHETKATALLFLKKTATELFSRRQQMLVERTHGIIHKINHYILEHLDGDLSLVSLAEVVYLNPSYLSILYKKSSGKNLSEYIAELRVEKSKELLARSSLKIHEIALAVGFGTAGYFTRFFKKHVGVTPQDYRSATEITAEYK
jgi:two-component system response regulator YesN